MTISKVQLFSVPVSDQDRAKEQAPWGRYVTFDDPDGNGIVLQATTGG